MVAFDRIHATKHVMPSDERVERALEGGDVERPAQAKRAGHVVRDETRARVVELPEELLAKRERRGRARHVVTCFCASPPRTTGANSATVGFSNKDLSVR